ncbi:exodeoxyribonuclease VII large subunit [Thalassotalea aquiviva]|uniref:exodeoxyribonuclease VII large subunit n=1 Tax=Thalassotalea aquiviva TaxID=3242415 RepID=UPI00352BCE81
MTLINASKQHILHVSELTKKVRFILESELHTVWLTGEISNFMAASSGHWYLSLKDDKSQVRCAMFKGNNRFVRLKPANGQQVLVKAKVSLYEPRGDFQLIIEQMEDAGEGLLRQKFEQLKAQLQSEGLFESRYKQPMPQYVQTVGLVTSSTGAAIKDILTVLKRRSPGIKVIIYPTLVQGEQAADQISDAIYTANERDECDVLIVGRGGGSLEDLWAFNEEPVVRAIFDCDIPVISAVGHEIDTSLSDFVADLRAPTPSAAAEIISADNEQLIKQIKSLEHKIGQSARWQLQAKKVKLQALVHRLNLTHPEHKLHRQQQRFDELQARLNTLLTQRMQALTTKLSILQQRLHGVPMEKNLAMAKQNRLNLHDRLTRAMLILKDNKQQQLANLAQYLNIMSPLATIARGYSITRDAQGKIVKDIKVLNVGDNLSTQIENGKIESTITKIEK